MLSRKPQAVLQKSKVESKFNLIESSSTNKHIEISSSYFSLNKTVVPENFELFSNITIMTPLHIDIQLNTTIESIKVINLGDEQANLDTFLNFTNNLKNIFEKDFLKEFLNKSLSIIKVNFLNDTKHIEIYQNNLSNIEKIIKLSLTLILLIFSIFLIIYLIEKLSNKKALEKHNYKKIRYFNYKIKRDIL